MRRKISLYIGERLADLDDQGIILYNYAFTDLETPSAVKNSFSKQITLPATARNLAIFGHPERTDRVTGNGVSGTGKDFNACVKTPFELRDELDCVLESGYIRLDSVQVKGRVVSGITITLFGGIGSFFYNLSYNADGTKKTLASLDYGITLGSFTINAARILAAWGRLRTGSGGTAADDIVNFAPAYNGVPEGLFSPDKAIINPSAIGLPDSVNEGTTEAPKVYHTKSGLSLLSLKKAQDEWACKDLRSYLQRPVLSMYAFLQAIARPANNGGYTVDYSSVPANAYLGIWKTLPMISSLGALKQETRQVGLAVSNMGQQTAYLGRIVYNGAVSPGATVSTRAVVNVAWSTAETDPILQSPAIKVPYSNESAQGYVYMVVFVQMLAMAGDALLAATTAKCLSAIPRTSNQIASFVGYTPQGGAVIESRVEPTAAWLGAHDYGFTDSLSFQVESDTASHYLLAYKCYLVTSVTDQGDEQLASFVERPVGALGTNGNAFVYYPSIKNFILTLSGQANYTTTSEARSGAVIPYASLLNSAYTPAEYLISFCKQNGLVFGYNPSERKITIMPRNTWFNGQITDLSGRIDRTQEITISPLALKTKWYDLKGTIVKGAMADEYEKKYGVQYAEQRVNTDYDFDAADEDIMKSIVFKGAVTILDHGPYWNILLDASNHLVPSIFLDPDATYTLYNDNGEGKNYQVPVPSGDVRVTYYNTDIMGYDKAYFPKLEFRDASNKALDGTDVLCRYVGSTTYNNFAVTDDTTLMLVLNNGKPCWNLTEQASAAVLVPIFHRYNALSALDSEITRSLDYGIPREVDLPDITFSTTAGSVYLRYWKGYLSDLLNENTKVMKCRVNFGGMQVGQELLRRFYYYEGSLWVLNKITNYSLTTWDPVECEFVQVRDTANYTNGQIL